MQGARRRDCHLWDDARVRLEEFEMLDHRVAGKAELAVDLQRVSLGGHPVKLDALVRDVERYAVEAAEKIEMPPRAAEFAIRGELQADLLLFSDRLFDLAVFDRAQCLGRDLVTLTLRARLFQRGGPQQAPHMVGAKWRRCSLHRFPPVGPLLLFLSPMRAGAI
jgi:hypothetical protein